MKNVAVCATQTKCTGGVDNDEKKHVCSINVISCYRSSSDDR